MKYLALAVLALSCLRGADDGVPAPSNVPGAEYPRIHSDLRVTFRVKAPEAQSVSLKPLNDGLGKNAFFAMTKDAGGTWTVTIPPARPGFHYYALLVDGVQVNDPSSRTYFGWGRESSGIEVPDSSLDFYSVNDVPHGDVRIHTYKSGALGTFRTAWVYTPANYDNIIHRQRYPVLYLQHGAGESERAWTEQGKANLILDNLIASGKAKPMIVVMENGYAQANRGADVIQSFDKLMANELVWNIDSSFRTLADRNNRAIAGLSMGGAEAIYTGLHHLDLFTCVAGMSGGPQILNDPVMEIAAKQLHLLWLGFGTEDQGYTGGKKVHEKLQAARVPHQWFETAGSHEWQVWRKSLYDLVPRLFR